MFKRLSILVSFTIFPVCLFAAQDTIVRDATFYSDGFNGEHTANGDTFYQTGYSAAICDLDLGQFLFLQSASTGVVVKVNDRPNCSRYPNIIDLSRSAFELFAPSTSGRFDNIQVTPLGNIGTTSTKGILARDTFSHLGIILDPETPNMYFAGDGIEISGKVTDGKKNVLLYMEREGGGDVVDILAGVESDNSFRVRFSLPGTAGKYTFIVASGNNFNTDKYGSITLLDRSQITYPDMITTKQKIIPKLETKDGKVSVVLPEKMWGELILKQENKTFQTSGTNISLQNIKLHSGKAQANIKGYTLSTNSSLDRSSYLPFMFSGSIILDRIHEKTGEGRVSIRSNTRGAILKFKTPTDTKIRDKYYLTLPTGEVREFSFASNFIAEDGYIKMGVDMSITVPFKTDGTYLIELVQSNGLAYVNLPLTRGQVWNVLSTISPEDIRAIRTKFSVIEKYVLNRLNIIRASLSRDFLVTDPELTRLAQEKVDDMIRRGYVGHVSPDGMDIVAFAKSKKFNLTGAVGENIAYGNVSDMSLQDGLEESGSHRLNIIRTEWKKVGIGYAVNNGNAYLVQIFGE